MYYQQLKDAFNENIYGVQRFDADSATSFIFDPANSDYAAFKIQVADGTPLEDPEGNVMTQEQVDEFLRTIP